MKKMMNKIPWGLRLSVAQKVGWLVGRYIAVTTSWKLGYERGKCGLKGDEQAEIACSWLIKRKLQSAKIVNLCNRLDRFLQLD